MSTAYERACRGDGGGEPHACLSLSISNRLIKLNIGVSAVCSCVCVCELAACGARGARVFGILMTSARIRMTYCGLAARAEHTSDTSGDYENITHTREHYHSSSRSRSFSRVPNVRQKTARTARAPRTHTMMPAAFCRMTLRQAGVFRPGLPQCRH